MEQRMKTYKPVRVVNPIGRWHTTRLNPRQKLTIKLANPKIFLDAPISDKAKFEISLHSDFLIIESIEEDADTLSKICSVNQKYDLSDWAYYGEVSLGEIKVRLINNDGGNNHECSICVILNSKKKDVLTVVNPASNSVKIYPHQILEVVCFEPKWNNWVPGKVEAAGLHDEWNYADNILVDNFSELKLQKVKYDIVGDRGELIDTDPLGIKNRYRLIPNPTLSPIGKNIVENELRNRIDPIREHHWWFSCDERSRKKIASLENENYRVCTLDFNGTCKETAADVTYSTNRSVDVIFAVAGKHKNKIDPWKLNPNSIECKMEVTKRIEDQYKQILVNPLSSEEIFFSCGYESLNIEIVEPGCFWSDLPVDIEWEFCVESHHLSPKYFKVTNLESYMRWGKKFQRVKIDNLYKKSIDDCEAKFLGALCIKCPTKTVCHDGVKRIAFWYGKKHCSEKTKHVQRHDSARKDHYKPERKEFPEVTVINNKKKEQKKLQLAEIKIEEIEFDTLADEKNTDTKIVIKKLCEVRNNNHTFCCPENLGPTQKKKEDQEFQKRTYNGNGKKKEEKTEKEKANGDVSGFSSVTVYNPKHLYRINILQNQVGIIRIDMPVKGEELWAVSYESIGTGIKILSNKVFSKSQEITFVRDKLPVMKGQYCIGKLKLTCSDRDVVIFVDLEIGDVTPEKSKSVIISHPINCFDGVTRKQFLRDFQHNETLVINPNNSLYINCPSSKWNENTWQVKIEQYQLPEKIDRNSLSEIGKDIDWSMPFGKLTPNLMIRYYIIQRLSEYQPHIETILRAVSDVHSEKYLPIAKITFTNSDHPKKVRLLTPYGNISTDYTIEKSIDVCVDLTPYRRKEVFLTNPETQSDVYISHGEMLIVKLTPDIANADESKISIPWMFTSAPDFLVFNGHTLENGDNTFRFIVKKTSENKLGWVHFTCGGRQKSLFAKFEKTK